jgi:hypothetical protein
MKKLFTVFVLLLFVSFSSFAQEKEKKVVNLEATKVAKTRGANANIKTDINLNAKDVAVPKPADDRGDFCRIQFDNWTGYSILVYVDGDFQGYLSPWSEGSVTVLAGYTTVYCVTSGGTYEWTAEGNCDSDFYYKLN